jgi:short-subunit dehydrogenase
VEIGGKTVLLTGATGGLGRAIATAIAERGGRLILSSRKSDELASLADSLPGEGHRVAVADLALEGAAERLVAEAGQIDILVANAGMPGGGTLQGLDPDELAQIIRVNFDAPLRMTRAVLPGMLEREEGHLVFVSSLQGVVVLAGSPVYTATKFGLRGFGMAMRDDLHGTGVAASVVLPGFIRDAGMFAKSGQTAPGGLGTASPEDVGRGVAKAVERDRAEVVVAPRRQGLGARLGLIAPRMTSRLTRRAAAKATAQVVEGQRAQ